MIQTADLAWIAGFLEGRGVFSGSLDQVSLSVAQPNPEPLKNLQGVLGGRLYQYLDQERRSYWRWSVGGGHAIGVAFTVYRWLSRRRRQQVANMVAKWKCHLHPRHHVMAGALTGESLHEL